MDFNSVIFNIVGYSILQVLCAIVLPEGRMRKFTMSVISFYLFYLVVFPLLNIV